VSGGFLYSLWEEQIHVDKEAAYNHIIREIVSEAGIQNGSSISVTYDPAYEKLEFHQLTIWRNNHPIQRLSKSAFKIIANEEDLQRFLYHGTYSALLILEDIRKGDLIEYSYTLSGQNPIFKRKFSRDIYFQGIEPVGHVYASLLVSKRRNLNIKSFNKVPAAKVTDINAFQKYEWETFNTPGVVNEESQPSWQRNFSYVQVSEYKSWMDVVNWALEVNPVTERLNGNLAARLKTLKANSGGNEVEFFRSAVRLVQDEVRYMGIENGEYSHRANNPEKVFNQRYGDCKDKSLLLASILVAGGINANLALINTYTKNTLTGFLPTPKAFNHVVVVATIYGKQVWVDPTMFYQGGTGTDIYFPDYGQALIIKKEINKLTPLPLPKKGKVFIKERYSITDEKSPVVFTFEGKYTLQQADYIRDRLASSSYEEIVKGNLDYYGKTDPNIAVKDTMVVKDDVENNEITIRESYLIRDFFTKDSANGSFVRGLYSNYIKDQLPSFVSNRKNPVGINDQADINHLIEVVLNSGWNIAEEHASITKYAYQFNRDVSAQDSVLSINYKFAYLDDHVPLAEVSAFAKDIQKLTSDLSYTFSYNPEIAGKSRLNYWIVGSSILFLTFLWYASSKIYKKKTSPSEDYLNGYSQPLSGWQYFIAFGLVVSFVRVAAQLLTERYFEYTLWEVFPATTTSAYFKSVYIFELAYNLFISSYALFCLFLMYMRRDILPKVIIGFYIANVAGILIDSLLASQFTQDSGESMKSIIQSLIAAAIWISYFMRSNQVKQTFVVPYPADQDFNISEHEESEEPEHPLAHTD
jgi:hypothetical protein